MDITFLYELHKAMTGKTHFQSHEEEKSNQDLFFMENSEK